MARRDLWPRVEPLLSRVERPARYLNHEWGCAAPVAEGDFAFCMIYPDTYELGQANQAVRILVNAVNAMGGIKPTSIPFIGDKGMFKLTSGSLTKAYDGTTDRIHYTIDGVAEVNSLNLKLGSMSVSSSSYVLPFTNNMTVDLTSGSKLSINQTASLLPGVETTIAKGAELVVSSGKSIYIYDRDEWVAEDFVTGGKFKAVLYAPGKHYNRTNADLKDVKMEIGRASCRERA